MRLTTRGAATAKAIADRTPFTTSGSMFGTRETWHGTGMLPHWWLQTWYEEVNHIDYVVYSYATPIAWHTPNGWTVPDARYSITTTKHQGNLYLVRM
jgi:hypothetical protein